MKNSIKKTFNTTNKCLSKLIYPQTLTYDSLPRMPKLQCVKVDVNTSHSFIEYHHKCITYILSAHALPIFLRRGSHFRNDWCWKPWWLIWTFISCIPMKVVHSKSRVQISSTLHLHLNFHVLHYCEGCHLPCTFAFGMWMWIQDSTMKAKVCMTCHKP